MAGLRFYGALFVAKCVQKGLHILGRNASHLPGMAALWFDPNFMSKAPKTPLAICVTGTNGKTTVANLIADALRADGKKVVNNRTGSNIYEGCATNLLNTMNWRGKCIVDAAVYEVDERASRMILPRLIPDYLVVTNLFRDSLKRNAHPDYIFSIINTYCPDSTKLILNADELCSSMLKKDNYRVFYGIDKREEDLKKSINIVTDYSICPDCGENLEYDYLRYHHIGHAKCPKCGFSSKTADYMATCIDTDKMDLVLKVKNEEITLPLISDILFNIYNEITVATALLELGISKEQVISLISQIRIPDSRLNKTEINGVSVTQAMSKGQSCISSCRTFDFVSQQEGKKAVVLAMDDYYDRKKSVEYIGWIYDVDYEFFNKEDVVQVVVGGPRCYDHKVRMLLAGIKDERIFCAEDEMDAVDLIDLDKVDSVYILYDTSTYELSCRMKEKLIKRLEDAQ